MKAQTGNRYIAYVDYNANKQSSLCCTEFPASLFLYTFFLSSFAAQYIYSCTLPYSKSFAVSRVQEILKTKVFIYSVLEGNGKERDFLKAISAENSILLKLTFKYQG